MAYTGTATKRNGPACSLLYFSSFSCLPFSHGTACLVLSWTRKRCGFKTFLFSPLESNSEATALHAASEIPPNFNKLSLYWRQCCCLFPSQTTSWALVQAPNWPLFSTACLGLSASRYLHIAAALCGTFSSNWHQCMRAPPAPAAIESRFPVALSLATSGSSHSSAANSAFSSSCIHLCSSLSAPSLLHQRSFLFQ